MPPPLRPSKPASLPYQCPMHGHWHSVDTVTHPLSHLPCLLSAPQGRNKDLNHRRSSPSGSSSRDSNTPSPGANLPVLPSMLVRRNSSCPLPRGSYVPKAGGSMSVGSLALEGPYPTRQESDSSAHPGPISAHCVWRAWLAAVLVGNTHPD